MFRELSVQHRTGRSSDAQVFELVGLERAPRMFEHRSFLHCERHSHWRRSTPRDQSRRRCRSPVSRRGFRCEGPRCPGYRHGTFTRARSCSCCGDWHGPHGWRSNGFTRQCGVQSRIHSGMRDDGRLCERLWRNANHMIGHSHTTPKCIFADHGCADRFIGVVNFVYISDVDDIRYVRHVPDVSDVQLCVGNPRRSDTKGRTVRPGRAGTTLLRLFPLQSRC